MMQNIERESKAATLAALAIEISQWHPDALAYVDGDINKARIAIKAIGRTLKERENGRG